MPTEKLPKSREVFQGSVQAEVYDAQNKGACSAEDDTAKEELLDGILCSWLLHFFMPILSLTVFSCLRETKSR